MTSLDAHELMPLLQNRCQEAIQYAREHYTLDEFSIITPYKNYLGINVQFTVNELKYMMQVVMWRVKDPRHDYHAYYDVSGYMVTHENRYPGFIEPELHRFSHEYSGDSTMIIDVIVKHLSSLVFRLAMDYD